MAHCFWFYSMMGEWSTWQWVVLDFSQFFWSIDTPETPGSVSAVFAENEIWNRLKQFLPVCPNYAIFAATLFWIGSKKFKLSYFLLFSPSCAIFFPPVTLFSSFSPSYAIFFFAYYNYNVTGGKIAKIA